MPVKLNMTLTKRQEHAKNYTSANKIDLNYYLSSLNAVRLMLTRKVKDLPQMHWLWRATK